MAEQRGSLREKVTMAAIGIGAAGLLFLGSWWRSEDISTHQTTRDLAAANREIMKLYAQLEAVEAKQRTLEQMVICLDYGLDGCWDRHR